MEINKRFSQKVHIVLIIILIISSVAAALSHFVPPQSGQLDIPLSEFSSKRAMRYVENIAKAPHPINSIEHDRVRDYIIGEIENMGFSADIQSSFETISRRNRTYSGNIQNIITKVEGNSKSNKAILLCAHYDSVKVSPGAADNGSSVAVLLETLRALKENPKMENDVVFLFSDGEEVALLGAKAFVESHPWKDEVGMVLNFEACGSYGASVMFEAGNNNLNMIKELQKVSANLLAYSFTETLYSFSTNNTDFTMFRINNIQGLNFAIFSNRRVYHTKFDNIKNLDERSVQHQGTYALNLVKHFGQMDLNKTYNKDGENAIYFNVFRSRVISYPVKFVLPMTIIIFFIYVCLVILGIKKRMLTHKGILIGVLSVFITGILTHEISVIYVNVAKILFDKLSFNTVHDTEFSKFLLIGLLLFVISCASLLFSRICKEIKEIDVITGVVGICIIVLVLFTFYLKESSYLLAWPTLVTELCILFLILSRKNTLSNIEYYVIFSLIVFSIVILFTPFVFIFYTFMGLQQAQIYMTLLSLPVGIIIPYVYLVIRSKRWILPAVCAFLGLAIVLLGRVLFDAQI